MFAAYSIATVVFIANLYNTRSSQREVFLRKSVLKICSKFTEEHPCRIVISIKLLCNFIEIVLRHGYSPVNLLRTFRHLFLRTPLDGCFCNTLFLTFLGRTGKKNPHHPDYIPSIFTFK